MLSERPNILYLHSHDTGRYVQPYGYAIPTPNIQRLAEQSVLFRKAFCASPTCSPSRACLLTGQYAHTNGMLGLAHRGFSLRDYRHHLVHVLRQQGYWSSLIGEQHISKEPGIIGYDRVYKIETSHVKAVAPLAIEILRNSPQQPFFLSTGFFETHRGFFEPTSPQDANYCRPPLTVPDTPQTRQDMASFQASAWSLDQGVGAVINALDASGLAENTLVICTTDHGLAFPGMKCTLTDHGIGVMLIMRGPGGFSGGKVIDAMVSQIDIFPTVCDLLGIEQPEWVQGTSFLPLIQGKVSALHDAIFAEATYHAAYEPQRAVRTDRWKYIRRYGDRQTPVLANCDDSPSKDLFMQYGWQNRVLASEQLYDLIFDPNEVANMASDPVVAPILREMRTRLDQWMISTDDPLLHGPVSAPAGAEINDPDQISPGDPTHIVS
ncbi:MAG TPA: sulfatase [Ktedonobacteraceae bacterium]|nr:sulfatase [Ktedonobacteraceae bacterium]